MYKAKCNNFCNGVQITKDEIYTAKQISNFDINDFDFIGEKKKAIETKPKSKSMTNASLKAK